MFKLHYQFFFLIFFILLPGAAVLSAQPTLGSLTGIISDGQKILRDAPVIIKSNTPGKYLHETVRTDSEGRFYFYALPLGIYEVKAKNFCTSSTIENIRISSDKTENLDIVLFDENCEKKIADDAAQWQACEKAAGKMLINLEDSDKGEIISQLLEDALIDEGITDDGLPVVKATEIVISSANIQASWLRPIPNFKFILLSEKEIYERADKKGDYMRFSFSDFEAQGSCVRIAISNSWAAGKKSKVRYQSGGSNIYLFRQENGRWIKKIVSILIS